MDWFLYDGDPRHERVKVSLRHRENLCILDLKVSKCDKKSLDNLVDGCNNIMIYLFQKFGILQFPFYITLYLLQFFYIAIVADIIFCNMYY